MKTLRIIFSRIVTYFSQNRPIFILYIIGMVVCSITLIFFYGNFLSSKTGVYTNEFQSRCYEIRFSNPVSLTKDDISKIQDFYMDGKIQEIEFLSVLDKDGNDSINFHNQDTDALEEPIGVDEYISGYLAGEDNCILVDSYINNNNDMMVNPEPNVFTDQQLKQSVIAAPKGKTGSVKIHGENFKIIRNVDNTDYVIPFEKYMSLKLRTGRMYIYTDAIWSKFAITEYTDYLKSIFDDKNYFYYIHDPSSFYAEAEGISRQEMAMLMAVFGCTAVAFMFLLKYLMDCARRENSILMMVGARRKHILLMSFLENMILTISCVIIASLIHIGFYKTFFSKVNIYEKLQYYPVDYVIIAGMILVATVIVQVPFMIVYWKNNIKSIKEGGI